MCLNVKNYVQDIFLSCFDNYTIYLFFLMKYSNRQVRCIKWGWVAEPYGQNCALMILDFPSSAPLSEIYAVDPLMVKIKS